ncbi:endospore germination permease [Haloimpatiens sp. FM7330]|uniref:GerAB/ArcD/ProY family transporter n=1 Tax=Haloimpatiens sp. FM7330 TaxID=3298610 RepID=UPI00363DECEC
MNGQNKKNFVTKYQLFATIVVNVVGVGIFSYANRMTSIVKSDGWIVTIVGGAITLGLLYLIYRIVRMNNFDNFYNILKNNFGSTLGKIIGIFFIVYNIFYISIGMRAFAEVLKMYLLEKTPTEFILLIMILTGMYVVRNEIKTLIKFNEIMFWLMFVPIYIVFIFVIKGADFTNVFPILHNPAMNYVKALHPAIFIFGGFEIAYLVLPHMKEKKGIPKVLFKSIVFITIFYVATIIFSLAAFGVKQTQVLLWPILTMIQCIDIPGGFVEQWEGIVMTFWILFYITTFVNTYYFSADILKNMFKLEDIKLSSLILIPFVYVIALYPENIASVYQLQRKFSSVLNIVNLVLIIFILFFISVIRRRGDKTYEKK